MVDSFSEQVLDLGFDYGASGGPAWSVTSTVSGGGFEKVNLNWSQPLGQYQIGDKSGEDCLLQGQYDYLYGFWMARRGPTQGFRYKDWGDFELIDELIGVGDGTTTQFQITKTYGDFVRIIKKIVSTGFQVRVGSSIPSYTLGANSGLITFATAPASGREIRVSGEFHVPVRFNESEWPGKFLAQNPSTGERWYELGSLTLRAIRL